MISKTTRHGISPSLSEEIALFDSRSNVPAFPNLSRSHVSEQLKSRLTGRDTINQGASSLCGPAIFLQCLISDYPELYARYVLELFEYGRSRLGDLVVEPEGACKSVNLKEGQISEIDWITLASLRDSENNVLDYASPSNRIAGITMPGSLTKWFKQVGYSSVDNQTALLTTSCPSAFQRLMNINLEQYHVCLFVNSTLCKHTPFCVPDNYLSTLNRLTRSLTPNHWVGLTQSISAISGNSHFEIYNWGRSDQSIHSDTSGSYDWLLGFLYGAVIVKREIAKSALS